MQNTILGLGSKGHCFNNLLKINLKNYLYLKPQYYLNNFK